ncbi:AP-4 complex subunit beta-1-like [Amblyomma americanum]
MQTEISRLASHLDQCLGVSDVRYTRSLLKKLYTLIVSGQDLSSLTGSLVKLLSSQDILSKKVACLFVTRCRDSEEVGLLAVNCLLKDSADPNPIYRGLALNTLFSVPGVMEQAVPRLLAGLEDASAHVRRAAVSCTLSLHHSHANIVDELDLADKLYAMIRDHDPIVVVQCMHALEEILRAEGGITVNKRIASYLLKQLPVFNNWDVISVFRYLKKYVPKTVEEALMFVNALDVYLTSNSIAVQLSAFELFDHATCNLLSYLQVEGVSQVWSKLSISLSFCEQEMMWTVLDWVEKFLQTYPDVFRLHLHKFYAWFSEPPALKVKKMRILKCLVHDSNLPEICNQFLGHCRDHNCDVRRCALQFIASLANKHSAAKEMLISELLPLLNVTDEVLVSDVLGAVCSLYFDKSEDSNKVFDNIVKRKWTCASAEFKCSLIDIISTHGLHFEPSVYILEDYIENIREEEEGVKQHLLSATLRLFFARPCEVQDLLGKVLDVLCGDDNPFLRAQAKCYYKLLMHDPDMVKEIVLSS